MTPEGARPQPGRTVTVQGHRMALHEFARDRYLSPSLAHTGLFEPFQTEWVAGEVRPGDVVLDLGAHIGYYTLLFARLVGPAGRVIAFEPDPDNFRLLRHNVTLNGYQNVSLYPKAVSDRCGKAQLFLSPDNAGDHRLHAEGESRQSVDVEVVTLDSVLGSYSGPIDLIKMDVQGSEGAALAGMRTHLARRPRVKLLTEFWPYGLLKAGYDPARFLAELQGMGFRLYEISEERRGVWRVAAEQLVKTVAVDPDKFTNLLCVKAPLEPGPGG